MAKKYTIELDVKLNQQDIERMAQQIFSRVNQKLYTSPLGTGAAGRVPTQNIGGGNIAGSLLGASVIGSQLKSTTGLLGQDIAKSANIRPSGSGAATVTSTATDASVSPPDMTALNNAFEDLTNKLNFLGNTIKDTEHRMAMFSRSITRATEGATEPPTSVSRRGRRIQYGSEGGTQTPEQIRAGIIGPIPGGTSVAIGGGGAGVGGVGGVGEGGGGGGGGVAGEGQPGFVGPPTPGHMLAARSRMQSKAAAGAGKGPIGTKGVGVLMAATSGNVGGMVTGGIMAMGGSMGAGMIAGAVIAILQKIKEAIDKMAENSAKYNPESALAKAKFDAFKQKMDIRVANSPAVVTTTKMKYAWETGMEMAKGYGIISLMESPAFMTALITGRGEEHMKWLADKHSQDLGSGSMSEFAGSFGASIPSVTPSQVPQIPVRLPPRMSAPTSNVSVSNMTTIQNKDEIMQGMDDLRRELNKGIGESLDEIHMYFQLASAKNYSNFY